MPTSPIPPFAQSTAEHGEKSTPMIRQLTLSAALEQALKTQPTMRQARAQTNAAQGRVEQARSGYLPQVTGTGSYSRLSSNYTPSPGVVPNANLGAQSTISTASYNWFLFSLTATQLIYDFGQTNGRWSAAESAVDSLVATEKSTRLQTVMNVQSAFYLAWAQHALIGVAVETLDDQNRHLYQIDASVKVGVRPEIDLAQARANVANARLQLINVQNAYETAKDQLNAAMGLMIDTNYDVADEEARAVEAEDGPIEPLVARALESRPDIVALDRQHEAQVKTIRSLRGAYGPSLVASAAGTEKGQQVNNMVPNWNVGLTLTWPIFQGGLTNGQIREAEANLEVIHAQLATLQIQIRTQVYQARLAVRAAKSSIGAADDALTNARLQLKLAEGRYAAGVGSIIELADAQVAYSTARAQVIQAHFNLSNSRAQLITALGLR
jgi:outer membrane protein